MKKSAIPPLWSEDLPYSQAYITKEIRIMADEVSRTFFYVHADINPATYETLKAHKQKIKNKDILAFLDEAQPAESGEGYSWFVLGSQESSYKEAEAAAKKLTDAVIAMHKLVIEFLGLEA